MHFPKLVIFDMDGVLFDTERLFMKIRASVMEESGFHQTFSEYMQIVGTSSHNADLILYKQYRKDFPSKKIFQATRAEMNQYYMNNGLTPKKGILTLLNWLKDNDVPCCIATSSEKYIAEKYTAASGIRNYFKFIIGEGDYINSKPDPDIFLLCSKISNTSPEQCLVIEDSKNGILAAYTGNFPVICIPDMLYPDKETVKKCLRVFNDGNELLLFLKVLLDNEKRNKMYNI